MASEPTIVVNAVSKKYLLFHQAANTTLRDTISAGIRRLNPWQKRPPQKEEFWALKDVSFSINKGEVVGIIGRNGAGKSTILKIISRITEPTQGSVRIRGRVASLLEVGTGFHPELSGRENIYLNGAILGMRRREILSKFDEIVAFAEVERFLDTPVKHYSSGMYVRLAFSVAAHLDTDILIVDEVLAVGDAAFQNRCLKKMHDVTSDQGRTVLLVSHNMVSVQNLCSRVIRLHKGTILGDGEPNREITAYYGAHLIKQETEISLQHTPRGFDPRNRARYVSASLVPADAATPWSIPFDQTLRLRFVLQVSTPLPWLEFGIAISNAQGVEIVSVLSSWRGTLGPYAAGTYAVEADFGRLNLAIGKYQFGLGLRSEAGFEDYMAEAFHLEVMPPAREKVTNLSTISGAIAYPAAFTVTRL